MPGQRGKAQEGAFPNPGNANIMRGEHRHQLGSI
jgi:hypothetical protein